MHTHGDPELVELARQGDGAAIGELFSRYWRAARAAAFGVTGEFASAEDAAAEGFRQALVGINTLRDPARFGPWLKTIVVRQAQLGLRSSRATADALTDAPADTLPDTDERPDRALERFELEVLVHQAVRALPARLREAVSLFYIEGYDSDAAARFLDIPAGTFRRRLHDARKQLRSAAKQILQGSRPLNQEREQEIEKLRSLIDNANGDDTDAIFKALRGAMALRPPAHELIEPLLRRQTESAKTPEALAGEGDFRERARGLAQRFGTPSERASDPDHPVGSIAAAIRQALPDFQAWQPDFGEAAERFFNFSNDRRARIEAMFPPGFAEGRPGAFLRSTRGLVLLRQNSPVQTAYQTLQDSPDKESFQAGMKNPGVSDVLDLMWMVTGSLELRSVQDLLERLISIILPEATGRFTNHDEPRYRSALRLQVGAVGAIGTVDGPAAIGGVLAEWPGHPQGVVAAHLRIYLEPWATVKSGQVVEFERLRPEMPR